jgi:hypothetical protein
VGGLLHRAVYLSAVEASSGGVADFGKLAVGVLGITQLIPFGGSSCRLTAAHHRRDQPEHEAREQCHGSAGEGVH